MSTQLDAGPQIGELVKKISAQLGKYHVTKKTEYRIFGIVMAICWLGILSWIWISYFITPDDLANPLAVTIFLLVVPIRLSLREIFRFYRDASHSDRSKE